MLPLHIFEERYRLLIREGSDFGVVMIRQGVEVQRMSRSEPCLHEVGTIAHPERVERLPDGRYNVLVRGLERFRLGASDGSRPYLRAAHESLPAVKPSRPRLAPLLQEYLAGQGIDVLLQNSVDFAARGTWLAGSLLQVEPSKLQVLLESGDPLLAEQLLSEEIGRLRQIGPLATIQPRGMSPN